MRIRSKRTIRVGCESIQHEAKNLDDFLSERREPTQRMSWRRVRVVGESSRAHFFFMFTPVQANICTFRFIRYVFNIRIMKVYGLTYVTAPNLQTAKKLAQICLSKKLTACVNIFQSVCSMYNWQDSQVEEQEYILILKTSEDLFETLSEEIKKRHSYECPCIVFIPFSKVEQNFLKWMESQLEKTPSSQK